MRFSDIVMRAATGGGGIAQFGPEMVVNGDFGVGTGWSGTGWSIVANMALYNAGGSNQDFSNTSGTAAEAGVTYTCTFTISTYSYGSVAIGIGGTYGTARTAVGTYTQDIVASGTGKPTLRGNNGTAYIDNVSIKKKNF